jgi:hypothetical protein
LGLLLTVLGVASYLRGKRWLGVTLLIVGFCELIYWTCPTFLGGATTKEFDRLLAIKLPLSVVSLGLWALVVRRLGVFEEDVRNPT